MQIFMKNALMAPTGRRQAYEKTLDMKPKHSSSFSSYGYVLFGHHEIPHDLIM